MTCFHLNFKPIVVAAAAWLTAISPSPADNDVWKAAADGSWSAGLSWVDGTEPDTFADTATINRTGAYTVSFVSNPAAIGALTLGGSANVTFASAIRNPDNPVPVRSLTLRSGTHSGNLAVEGFATLTLGSVTGQSPPSQAFNLTAEGTLSVAEATTLNLAFGSVLTASGTGATNIFQGNVNINSGSLILGQFATTSHDGVVTVSGSGSRLVSSNQLSFDASEDWNGTLFVSAGGLVECSNATVGGAVDAFVPVASAATVTGSGSLWEVTNQLQIGAGSNGSETGTVSIGPGATVSVGQGTSVTSRGDLRLQGGIFETGEFRGDELGGGLTWTSGTYRVGTHHDNLINSSGTLAPGQSAGVTTVVGDYTQQSGGTLEIEIGGVVQGSLHDFVNVTEDLGLGGLLDIKRINGFVPAPSQNFTIMSADSISGAFANVASGQRLAISGGGSFLVHYGVGSPFNPNHVVLSSFLASVPGDYNGDGAVNAADYTVWRDTRGSTTNLAADGSGNGTVDTADYNFWRARFGSTAGAASSPTAVVPEPGAVLLPLAGVLVCLAQRKLRLTG